jgi:hypothetical protein
MGCSSSTEEEECAETTVASRCLQRTVCCALLYMSLQGEPCFAAMAVAPVVSSSGAKRLV